MQGISIRCKQECVPIVYDARYDIEATTPQLVLPLQSIHMIKPFAVFSRIQSRLYLTSQTIQLNGIILFIGEYYKTVKSIDIATVYDISGYVSAPIRQVIATA